MTCSFTRFVGIFSAVYGRLPRPAQSSKLTVYYLHRCLLFFWGIFVSISVAFPLLAQRADDDDLREQLLLEAPKSWKRMEDASRHLEVTGNKLIRNLTRNEVTGDMHWVWKLRDDSRLALSADNTNVSAHGDQDHGIEERVRCTNSRYSFVAAREDGGPFEIIKIGTNGLGNGVMSSVDSNLAIFGAPWQIVGMPLTQLFDSPEFSLNSVSGESENSGAVRVEFERIPASEGPDQFSREGWVVLDSQHLWRVMEYQVQTTQKGNEHVLNSHVKIDYREDKNGLPIPKRRVLTRSVGGTTEEFIFDYDVYRYGEVPTDEFTLSAFGLPEFQSTDERRSRVFAILIAIFFIAAILAVVLRRAAKRARPTK